MQGKEEDCTSRIHDILETVVDNLPNPDVTDDPVGLSACPVIEETYGALGPMPQSWMLTSQSKPLRRSKCVETLGRMPFQMSGFGIQAKILSQRWPE